MTNPEPPIDAKGVELKPCPFCGARAVSARVDRHGGPTCYRAFCTGCLCRTDDIEDRASAIAAWNTRAPASTSSPAMDREECGEQDRRELDELLTAWRASLARGFKQGLAMGAKAATPRPASEDSEGLREAAIRGALCLSGFAGEGLVVDGYEDPADAWTRIAAAVGLPDGDENNLRDALGGEGRS